MAPKRIDSATKTETKRRKALTSRARTQKEATNPEIADILRHPTEDRWVSHYLNIEEVEARLSETCPLKRYDIIENKFGRRVVRKVRGSVVWMWIVPPDGDIDAWKIAMNTAFPYDTLQRKGYIHTGSAKPTDTEETDGDDVQFDEPVDVPACE